MAAAPDRLKLLQLELETLSGDDPRRAELAAGVCDLLHVHGEEWAGPRAKAVWKALGDELDRTTYVRQFGPVFGNDDQWEFRGGELAACRISAGEFLTHGAEIRSRTNLQELTLHTIGGDGIAKHRQARLDKLKSLNAPDVLIQYELERMAKLKDYCPIESLLGYEPLCGIRSLRFERMPLFGPELEAFAEAPFLEDLESFYMYQSTDTCHDIFRRLADSSQLQSLDIECYSEINGDRDFEVGNADDARILARSYSLKNLHTLRLRFNDIGDKGLAALVDCERLSGLRRLDLRGNYSITSRGIIKLADTYEAQRLRSLNLSQTKLDNNATIALARSQYLLDLEELDLQPWDSRYEEKLEITGRDFIVALCKPDRLPALRRLNIAHQLIGDEGTRVLAGAPRFARFTHLGLAHQDMTDEGLIALATSPHPPQLQSLDLGLNPIGDAGLKALCQSPLAESIQFLRIKSTPDAGALLADSRFNNLLELQLDRADDSIFDPIANSKRLPLLRRLVGRSSKSTRDLLLRTDHPPVHLLPL